MKRKGGEPSYAGTFSGVSRAGGPERQVAAVRLILIGEMDVGAYACESYGIKVAEQGGEQALVENITCSASRIDELSGLLVRNSVTPAALHDVVSDWL